MCLTDLNQDNVARMTGNPSSREAWLRTHLLGLVRDYPLLLQEVVKLSKPVTYTVAYGDDAGEYQLERGLRAPLRKKIEKLFNLALEVQRDLEDLPKSGDAWAIAKSANTGVKRGRRDDSL